MIWKGRIRNDSTSGVTFFPWKQALFKVAASGGCVGCCVPGWPKLHIEPHQIIIEFFCLRTFFLWKNSVKNTNIFFIYSCNLFTKYWGFTLNNSTATFPCQSSYLLGSGCLPSCPYMTQWTSNLQSACGRIKCFTRECQECTYFHQCKWRSTLCPTGLQSAFLKSTVIFAWIICKIGPSGCLKVL